MNRYSYETEENIFGRKMMSKAAKEKDDFRQLIPYYATERIEISSKQNNSISNIEHQLYKCKPNDTLDEIKINQYRTRLQKKEMLSRGDAFDKPSEDLSDLQMKEQQELSERYV